MTIDLADFESRRSHDGQYKHDLKTIQDRLERIQVAHIIQRRAAVVMLEGWDAAGKGGIIQRLTATWDPRHFEVYPIAAPDEVEKAHNYLWRFENRMPTAGNVAIFDRSWYGRVLVERVEGYATDEEWGRAYGEINAFEQRLVDGGTTLVKLFVHVSQKEQDKRLKARIENPWKRWKTGLDDYRNRDERTAYLGAMHDMFARTDTVIAPWTPIDGNDKKAARIAALTAIADGLERQVSMTPPLLDPAVVAAARAAGVID